MSLKEKLINSLDVETCSEFGLQRNAVIEFFGLSADDENKATCAKSIIESLLFQHSKDDLLMAVNDLSSMEQSLRNIGIQNIRIRDHVCHSVYTYCLGIYLIKQFGLTVTKFQWMLASILHDVGYPLGIAMKLAKQLEVTSNKYLDEMPVAEPEVVFGLRIRNLSRLSTGQSAVRLLTSRLRKWGFAFSTGTFMEEIERTGKVNHGVISSVFVCKFIERLYRKNNPGMISGIAHRVDQRDWNYNNFYNDIVEIATSIMLHSLPKEVFIAKQLDIDSHALPFLLRFSDELQDWDRVGRNEAYNDPSAYDLEFMSAREVKITLSSEREDLKLNFDCFSGLTITFQC